ncbi:YwmB family TATA-box binding protein [Tepidibacter aestuarii]|uniref:YwmB family TATA-box binding protein n=1 Tax=Tepidibacter aestuarii TaxID=2925782 RepID=UPI0020C09503|nr:YwmB family TATA-box binding protein [Tepidibacter aestuarii]CAH2211858.1 TATA-box binding [Tepidibacter aestuarii]
MKRIFGFIIILVLFFSMASSAEQVNVEDNQKDKKDYELIIDSFEKTNSTFDNYNINGHAMMDNKFLSFEEMDKIVDELVTKFDIDKQNIEYTRSEQTDFRQIYVYDKNRQNKAERGISIIIDSERCQSMEQTHIIVDINTNQVYKGIVEDYIKLKNNLKKYSKDIDIYSCISGFFEGKIDEKCYNNIVDNILSNLDAQKKDEIQDVNILSTTGYTKKLSDCIKYGEDKINVNASIRYSEYDDKTFIYIGTPLITLEY